MEGVRLGKDELVRTYGISRRLAVRVGALLAKGFEVSGTLLEIAGPGSAVEKLLLHPETLASADRPTVEAIRKLARETGAASEGELALAESPGGGRVLALAEELLAQEGWRGQAAKEPTALAPRPGFSGMPVLDRKEASGLFNAEEIARLKLDALAGRDADERVSALRKLVYAPISAHEKGGIYLRALLDSAGPVRSEAMKAIESLGFNRDMADAIQALFAGRGRARGAALRRIGDLMGRLNPAERKIALAVLLETFRESQIQGPNDPMLELLDEADAILAESPEIVPEMARVYIQHLLAAPAKLGETLRDRLARLAAAAPAAVLGKVWEEIGTVSEPGSRALLLGLLIETEQDEERRVRLCGIVAEELVRREQDEVMRQKLGHALVKLGPPAAEALLARFAAGSNPERAALVQFLDAASVDQPLPPETLSRIAGLLLEALKLADLRLRAEILNTRILAHPQLSPEFRRAAAQALLPLLRSADHPESSDRAAALLETLGEVAAEGLLDVARKHPNAPEAETAIRALGRILGVAQPPPAVRIDSAAPAQARAPVPHGFEQLVRSAYDFLSRRVASPATAQGGAAAALGLIASSPAVSPEEARKALELLLSRLGRVRWHGDLVEAIGRVGAGAGISAEQRIRVSHLLGRIIERPSSREDARLREVQTSRGKVYEIAGRIEFDSETLPAAVRGLEAIALSPETTGALRRQVAEQLLRTWEGVGKWTVIWGPRAAETLVQTLGRIGADERSDGPTRARIAQGLLLGIERLSVVRALEAIFSPAAAAPELGGLAAPTGAKLLDHWIQPEITPEELQAVLSAAAGAACRPEIPARSPQARRLRERVSELLFDALRTGHPWARPALQKMRDSAAIPARMRKEIAGRLDQAISVLRMDRGTTRTWNRR
jgi:transposase